LSSNRLREVPLSGSPRILDRLYEAVAALARDARGLTTMEYSVVFVLIGVGGLGTWSMVSKRMKSQVDLGTNQFNATLQSHLNKASSGAALRGQMLPSSAGSQQRWIPSAPSSAQKLGVAGSAQGLTASTGSVRGVAPSPNAYAGAAEGSGDPVASSNGYDKGRKPRGVVKRPGRGADDPVAVSKHPGRSGDAQAAVSKHPGRGDDAQAAVSKQPGRGDDAQAAVSKQPGRGDDDESSVSKHPGRGDDESTVLKHPGRGSDDESTVSKHPGRASDDASAVSKQPGRASSDSSAVSKHSGR
jgi:Flp pilus assembly pilin Flp